MTFMAIYYLIYIGKLDKCTKELVKKKIRSSGDVIIDGKLEYNKSKTVANTKLKR